jgi:hypothetical protein
MIQNKKKARRSLDVIPALAGKWFVIFHQDSPKTHLRRTLKSWDPKYDCTPNL